MDLKTMWNSGRTKIHIEFNEWNEWLRKIGRTYFDCTYIWEQKQTQYQSIYWLNFHYQSLQDNYKHDEILIQHNIACFLPPNFLIPKSYIFLLRRRLLLIEKCGVVARIIIIHNENGFCLTCLVIAGISD